MPTIINAFPLLLDLVNDMLVLFKVIQIILSFPRNTSQRKMYPYDIYMDTKDNILLGDYNSNMVLLYTSIE